jgi:predicted adenylyl cyclase CyaB
VDHVLRLRVYRDTDGTRCFLDWKGPTRQEGGYKVREEISTQVSDAAEMAQVLDRLGYVVTREIDREIAQYDLNGAVVRFERYPRMDTLVEVEGSARSIEHAIRVLGMERSLFTTERLLDYVSRYELRTGERAAVSDAELRGDYTFSREDA